ncbi:rhodanese-like domain-containing protein [Flaviaesturariibacter aridisoli]|uniref:Rhodanese-like domain-containing protein n=1 Tax=Flaviaesturariibacter aridisoli TaxID=2545761 RepID=A0A4R4E1M9_9BACT|nr:rhodanese-like domain-containing protein [Flaviaesturariibacter aridisoli]TCZ73336.1 rhodanese-like domain-containing protein [Flaviaesturariibacter aridisoli]
MNLNLEDAVIVDVRTPDEYRQQHIPNAVNIPLDQLAVRFADIRSWGKPVVFYCRVGNRSGMAVSMLKQQGFADVYNGGGLEEMKRALSNTRK